MRKSSISLYRAAICLFVVSLIFTPAYADNSENNSDNQQLALPTSDLEAPTVTHTPPNTVSEDGSITITAKVVDNDAVESVIVYYRTKGDAQYQTRSLNSNDGENYSVTLSVKDSSLEYYLQAEDKSGNTLLHGYSFAPIVLSFNNHKAEVVSLPTKHSPVFANLKDNQPFYKNKWLWIGLGIALGAVALSSSDNGDDPQSVKPTSTSVVINGPAP